METRWDIYEDGVGWGGVEYWVWRRWFFTYLYMCGMRTTSTPLKNTGMPDTVHIFTTRTLK